MRIVLSALLLTACGVPDQVDSQLYIKGGVSVKPTDFVYNHTVAVGDITRPYCSGTLIRHDIVLTAAHCVTDDAKVPFTATESMRVYFDNGKTAEVEVQAWHEGYSPDDTVASGMTPPPNDLAILKLKQDLPAPMTPAVLADQPVLAGKKAILAGYGTLDNRTGMNSRSLRMVDVEVTNVDTSKKRIDTNNPYINNKKGACAGDSGGSIFIDGKLYGALSIGTTIRGGGCGGWNSYTNIFEYIDLVDVWIGTVDAAESGFVTLPTQIL
jgi:secreted trypsin-like serine protease